MRAATTLWLVLASFVLQAPAKADEGGGDLEQVRHRGVLRHLGVPYAAFITGAGDGFDVELVREFARRLGVGYEFVPTDWANALPDLTGRRVSRGLPDPALAAPARVRGDLVASGLTVLPWRARSAAFSAAVFPTQVWVIAAADSVVQPIRPSGELPRDIAAVKSLLVGRRIIGVPGTCLDPTLYQLEQAGAAVHLMQIPLDDVAAALIQGEGDLSLLDVADAIAAMRRYPGRIKVIGPVSEPQIMAAAFRRGAPQLRHAFDEFLVEAHRDGTYDRLVSKYFPEAPLYFGEFFGGER